MSGLTTDVCLVPAALSAKKESFNIVALFDSSAACTKTAEISSRNQLEQAGIPVMTTLPAITGMLGDYTNPASGAFFAACEIENMYEVLGNGNVR